MAKIVLTIALLLTIASGTLSYLSRDKVIGLKGDLSTTKDQLSQSQRKVADTQKKLDDTTTQLTAANQKADNLTAQVSQAQQKITNQEGQIAKLDADLKEAQRIIGSTRGGPSTDAGPAGVPREEYEKVVAELKNTQNEVAKAKDEAASQKSRANDAESRAKTLEQAEQRRKSLVMRPGIEAQVQAVNPSLGFVVLNIGDRQGAVANTEMIIERNGERIGKVRISSVEPSTSVADIIPSSLARGVRIQPGDRVIFQPNAP